MCLCVYLCVFLNNDIQIRENIIYLYDSATKRHKKENTPTSQQDDEEETSHHEQEEEASHHEQEEEASHHEQEEEASHHEQEEEASHHEQEDILCEDTRGYPYISNIRNLTEEFHEDMTMHTYAQQASSFLKRKRESKEEFDTLESSRSQYIHIEHSESYPLEDIEQYLKSLKIKELKLLRVYYGLPVIEDKAELVSTILENINQESTTPISKQDIDASIAKAQETCKRNQQSKRGKSEVLKQEIPPQMIEKFKEIARSIFLMESNGTSLPSEIEHRKIVPLKKLVKNYGYSQQEAEERFQELIKEVSLEDTTKSGQDVENTNLFSWNVTIPLTFPDIELLERVEQYWSYNIYSSSLNKILEMCQKNNNKRSYPKWLYDIINIILGSVFGGFVIFKYNPRHIVELKIILSFCQKTDRVIQMLENIIDVLHDDIYKLVKNTSMSKVKRRKCHKFGKGIYDNLVEFFTQLISNPENEQKRDNIIKHLQEDIDEEDRQLQKSMEQIEENFSDSKTKTDYNLGCKFCKETLEGLIMSYIKQYSGE